jgi:hypothetical protein
MGWEIEASASGEEETSSEFEQIENTQRSTIRRQRHTTHEPTIHREGEAKTRKKLQQPRISFRQHHL